MCQIVHCTHKNVSLFYDHSSKYLSTCILFYFSYFSIFKKNLSNLDIVVYMFLCLKWINYLLICKTLIFYSSNKIINIHFYSVLRIQYLFYIYNHCLYMFSFINVIYIINLVHSLFCAGFLIYSIVNQLHTYTFSVEFAFFPFTCIPVFSSVLWWPVISW